MDESDDYIDRAIKWYLIYRFLWMCFALVLLIIFGICGIIDWVYNELSLEHRYRLRYGAVWQMEFEKDHGSLSHAHMQLVICTTSILAVVAILAWFCRQTFHRHKKHVHTHNSP
jgi:hypothetical protein